MITHYSIETVNPFTDYIKFKNEVIGAAKSLPCGHTEFRFKDCQILFHLHVRKFEQTKLIDCVNALTMIDFDHADCPAMSIPFHHEQCNIDSIMEFKTYLIKSIAEAKKIIEKIARGEYGGEIKWIDGNDVYQKITDPALQKDEKQFARRRPLNANESVMGFIQFLINDAKENGVEDIEGLKETLNFVYSQFIQKNPLPSVRDGWEQYCVGI